MTDELIGVTTCPTCQKRFRILKKHESFIGKTIACPKCHRPFVIGLQTPAPIEQAAMMASTTNSSFTADVGSPQDVIAKPKKKKKTKAEIRKATYKRMRKEFGPYMQQLQAMMSCDAYSEEKVRVWCIGVLKSVLGYEDADLDLELAAVGKKIDIAVKHDGKVILIIECKKHNTLAKKARLQAVNYACSKAADWAVVTNGQTWELHRVIPLNGTDPRVVQVFNISLLDEDGLSPYDLERLYLLTKRALLRGETEKEFHRAQCLDDSHLYAGMFSERAIKAIRRSLFLCYQKECKVPVKLSDEDVYDALKELIRPEELGGDL